MYCGDFLLKGISQMLMETIDAVTFAEEMLQ